MKLKDMTPEQRREYNRDQKRKSRANTQQAQEAKKLRDQQNVLENRGVELEELDKIRQQIALELGLTEKADSGLGFQFLPTEWDEPVWLMMEVLNGIKNHRRTYDLHNHYMNKDDDDLMPFPDSAASTLIEFAHTHDLPPSLEGLFVRLLTLVVPHFEKNPGSFEEAWVIEAKQELTNRRAGIKIRIEPNQKQEPKPELRKIQEVPSVPSDAEILEQGRLRLLNQLQANRVQDPNLSRDARRYLDGTA